MKSKEHRYIKLRVALLWIFNLLFLVTAERTPWFYKRIEIECKHAGFDYKGFVSWRATCNLFMLKCLSFTIDTLRKKKNSSNHNKNDSGNNSKAYSFVSFIAYCFYPPLYLAGPIMTFNMFIDDYMFHTKKKNEMILRTNDPKTQKKSKHTTLVYFIRFLLCFLLHEVWLRVYYISAMNYTKYTRQNKYLLEKPFWIASVGIITVMGIW